MKLQFTIILEGDEKIAQKFEKSLVETPTLANELVRAIGQNIVLAFNFLPEDSINIHTFKAGILPEGLEPTPEITPETLPVTDQSSQLKECVEQKPVDN